MGLGATLVGKDRGQGGRLPMVRMILYGNSDEKTADRAIGFSFFFRQYLVDFGDPIDGSLFAGEAVDCFGLATPNNLHHPAKSGIAFSHFENGWLGHLANIRLSVPAFKPLFSAQLLISRAAEQNGISSS